MTYPEAMKRNIINRTMQRFVTAKGKDYYLYLRLLDKHLHEDLTQAIETMRATKTSGLLSYADMCHLLVMFSFPANRMKSLMTILENHRLIPAGSHNKTKHHGVRASLVELGYEKCPNSDCWRWFDEHCVCEKIPRNLPAEDGD